MYAHLRGDTLIPDPLLVALASFFQSTQQPQQLARGRRNHMEHSASASATTSSSSSQRAGARELQLQGPRPAPLKVRKDSHKIRKPPPPQQQSAPALVQVRQPVIIYTASPKVVHANPSEFMSVVQRLTGARTAASATATLPAAPPPVAQPTRTLPFPFFAQASSSSTLLPAPQPQFPFPLQAAGPHEDALQLSPAARLTATEQARSHGGDTAGGLPPLPSILSPVLELLPVIPASFFSPPAGGINLLGELIGPAFLGHHNALRGSTTITGATPMLHFPAAPSPFPAGAGANAGAGAGAGAGAYYWDLFNNNQQYRPNPNL